VCGSGSCNGGSGGAWLETEHSALEGGAQGPPAAGWDRPRGGGGRRASPEAAVDAQRAASPPCTADPLAAFRTPSPPVPPQVEIPKAKVELWWPAGHGAQTLYEGAATWNPKGGPLSCGDAPSYNTDDPALKTTAAPGVEALGCSVAKRQIGFRTIELVTNTPAQAGKELAPEAPTPTGADAEGERLARRAV
jgi:hypothetical protein